MKMFAIVAVVAAAGFWSARPDEGKIPLDQVPAKVKAAVEGRFPGAKLTGAEREKEGDKLVYEIALTIGGSKVEALVSDAGAILEVEREIDAAALPKSVKAALEAKHPQAKIKKAEEVIKGGDLFYEAVVSADQKDLEIKFAAEWRIASESTIESKSNEGKK